MKWNLLMKYSIACQETQTGECWMWWWVWDTVPDSDSELLDSAGQWQRVWEVPDSDGKRGTVLDSDNERGTVRDSTSERDVDTMAL